MATVVELDQERFANICLWNYLELSSFHWSVVYCLFKYLEDMADIQDFWLALVRTPCRLDAGLVMECGDGERWSRPRRGKGQGVRPGPALGEHKRH